MRRKTCLATLTMAAMVAVSLAGCGSSGEKADNSQTAVSGETTAADSGQKKKDSGSATVVSMWHMWSGSEAEAFQTMISMPARTKSRLRFLPPRLKKRC